MKSTVFKNNRTQAIRIPKALAFPDDVKEVEIVREGDSLFIRPLGRNWDEYFAKGRQTTPDFMSSRDQPAQQDRKFKWR